MPQDTRIVNAWNPFSAFVQDMPPRPSLKHTIHRIDDNGHYEPGNCVWATHKEQMMNCRRTRLITVDGIADSMNATAIRIGLDSGSLRWWIKRGYFAQDIVDRWRKRPFRRSVYCRIF